MYVSSLGAIATETYAGQRVPATGSGGYQFEPLFLAEAYGLVPQTDAGELAFAQFQARWAEDPTAAGVEDPTLTAILWLFFDIDEWDPSEVGSVAMLLQHLQDYRGPFSAAVEAALEQWAPIVVAWRTDFLAHPLTTYYTLPKVPGTGIPQDWVLERVDLPDGISYLRYQDPTLTTEGYLSWVPPGNPGGYHPLQVLTIPRRPEECEVVPGTGQWALAALAGGTCPPAPVGWNGVLPTMSETMRSYLVALAGAEDVFQPVPAGVPHWMPGEDAVYEVPPSEEDGTETGSGGAGGSGGSSAPPPAATGTTVVTGSDGQPILVSTTAPAPSGVTVNPAILLGAAAVGLFLVAQQQPRRS
jgi:hypothetical protein